MSDTVRSSRTARNDPHASSACESCRARKIKCDTKRPSCGACLRRGAKCTWTVEKDGRAPRGPLLEQIAQLRAENARLQEENAALKSLLWCETPGSQTAEATPTSGSSEASPPGAPGTLLNPSIFEPFFAQLPPAGYDPNFFNQSPSFATDASYAHLSQQGPAHLDFYEQTTAPAAPFPAYCTEAGSLFIGDEFGQQAGYMLLEEGQ